MTYNEQVNEENPDARLIALINRRQTILEKRSKKNKQKLREMTAKRWVARGVTTAALATAIFFGYLHSTQKSEAKEPKYPYGRFQSEAAKRAYPPFLFS